MRRCIPQPTYVPVSTHSVYEIRTQPPVPYAYTHVQYLHRLKTYGNTYPYQPPRRRRLRGDRSVRVDRALLEFDSWRRVADLKIFLHASLRKSQKYVFVLPRMHVYVDSHTASMCLLLLQLARECKYTRFLRDREADARFSLAFVFTLKTIRDEEKMTEVYKIPPEKLFNGKSCLFL